MMEHIPILKLDEFLLVTIQVELHDSLALTLQDDLMATLERSRARGVLLDLSSVQIVDSFMARILGNIAAGVRLIGAETVIVGIQPAVAMTLVEMGITLPGILTALDVDRGLALLRQRLDARLVNG